MKIQPRNISVAQWQPERAGEYLKERKLDVVYGPITSRRLGLSLGVNPIQPIGEGTKPFACNWNCVYCQYGAESLDDATASGRIRFTTPKEVREALERRLKSTEHFDSITICGPTEPTISPHFDKLVDLVVEVRDMYRPGIQTSLFTNATRLRQRNLILLDYVFMKLDAGNEDTFLKFNRPRGVKFSDLVDELRLVQVKRRIIQTAVVGGNDGNLSGQNLRDYNDRIKEIRPDEVHLYPLLYKPHQGFDLRAIGREELGELSKEIASSTGAEVKTFFDPVRMGEEFKF